MHKVSLTLNQDKRRWFDSTPGSITAGETPAGTESPTDQNAECSHWCSLEASAGDSFDSRRPLSPDLHGHPSEVVRVHNPYTNGAVTA